jgi:hypothetical protein
VGTACWWLLLTGILMTSNGQPQQNVFRPEPITLEHVVAEAVDGAPAIVWFMEQVFIPLLNPFRVDGVQGNLGGPDDFRPVRARAYTKQLVA